jgi:hypothetical protein
VLEIPLLWLAFWTQFAGGHLVVGLILALGAAFWAVVIPAIAISNLLD